ncbi:MAG: hypothetical protein WAW86_07220 [Gammaproteobacteria bacterium]
MSEKNIVNLINDYLDDIQIFMKLFKDKYQREDVLRAWHEGSIPKSGSVTDKVEYELHGVGCCVYFPHREVDFDFGPGSRFDGFDLWRLKQYLSQREDLSGYLSKDDLESEFNRLIENNEIEKVYSNSSLYFFKNSKI